ncbi:RNase H domain-containing protein [Ditylenchus destructor]|uniref:RNase H domain-containing protein n=1 Tax=Ditylenchus destructor TaxID=166010 RepID=A0AAD4MRC4_9BILA|nr:RNase H domain-containing protein [Ditylenchus destructor]
MNTTLTVKDISPLHFLITTNSLLTQNCSSIKSDGQLAISHKRHHICWRTVARGRNVDLITELDNLMHMIRVNFKYVKAHAGIYGNEMADQLARQGAQKNVR